MKYLNHNRRILLTLTIIIFALLVFPSQTSAHGKEVEIIVTSLIPDSSQPLIRLYRAEVYYSDGDLVEDAEMVLTAVREEGGDEIGPIVFIPLDEAGVYVTEVTYDRFGNWVVTVSVTEPGEGDASFTEPILPGQTAATSSGEETGSSGIPANLSVLFKFDWLDFFNIILRIVHSLAGLAWSSLIAVILVAFWFMPSDSRQHALNKLGTVFTPVAYSSLGILLASGIYNGIWDAPIRPPGVFNLPVMLDIPFGNVYLITFIGKLVAYGIFAWITKGLRKEFDLMTAVPDSDDSSEGIDDLEILRLAKIGLFTIIFLAVNIAVMIYMHYISHLAVLIPQ